MVLCSHGEQPAVLDRGWKKRMELGLGGMGREQTTTVALVAQLLFFYLIQCTVDCRFSKSGLANLDIQYCIRIDYSELKECFVNDF